MDHYAADVAAVVEHLDLRNAIHIGHSTGGGEATRYVARHGSRRAVSRNSCSSAPCRRSWSRRRPIRAACPSRFSTACGSTRSQPRAVLPRFRERSLLRLQPAGREGDRRRDPELVAPGHDGEHQGALRRHQGLLGDGLHRRPENITVPTLVMHGDDDQIVPIANSALLSVKLLKNGDAEGLREVSARHVGHERRGDQRRLAGLPAFRGRGQKRSAAETGSREETTSPPARSALWPFQSVS